jgi:hypothetical protein
MNGLFSSTDQGGGKRRAGINQRLILHIGESDNRSLSLRPVSLSWMKLEHVPPGLNREDSPGAVYEGFYRHCRADNFAPAPPDRSRFAATLTAREASNYFRHAGYA